MTLKFIKLNKRELVSKYKDTIIKKGSKILQKTKDFEIVGVRNTRDRKWFMDVLVGQNATQESVNYKRFRIAQGKY